MQKTQMGTYQKWGVGHYLITKLEEHVKSNNWNWLWTGADWGQKLALDFLPKANLVRNTLPHHKWVAYSWHYNWSFLVYMANSKTFFYNFYDGQFNITKVKYQYYQSIWHNTLVSSEDLNSTELFLWAFLLVIIYSICPFAGTWYIILRNRAPIVEKSILIILMMKNTVNSSVKYIMLQFEIAVSYANI